MKSYKDFISSNPTTTNEEVVEQPLQQKIELLEADDLPDFVYEDKTSKTRPNDPPAVLIMKRKTIRQFPNGQRVALYYIDKINKYVTVPYSDIQLSASVREETGVLNQLHQIVDSSSSEDIILEDGNKIFVSCDIAERILVMYEKLNGKNKQMVLEMVKSKDEFKKVINFAQSNLK